MIQNSIVFQERKVNYFSKGDVSKGAVVFIHGNSLDSTTFSDQFDHIDAIPMLSIDLPGHGNSEPALHPDSTYSLPGYVSVVKHVIKELQLSDFILVGHSLGGHVALEAIDELDFAKALVLFGAPPLGIPLEMDKAFFSIPAMAYLFQERLNEDEVSVMANSIVSASKSGAVKISIMNTDGKARSSFAASVAAGLFKNEKELILNLKKPVAIFHGEHDVFIKGEYIEQLNIPKLWKNNVQVIENASHSPQLDQPQHFNQLLQDFYQSVNSQHG